MEIRLTLQSIEGKMAILVDEQGKSVSLPLSWLPKEIEGEDAIYCRFLSENEFFSDKHSRAKEIINEMLNHKTEASED